MARNPQDTWTDDDALDMIAAEAAEDELSLMKALRRRIVARLADPEIAARDLATLSLRLVDIGREVNRLDPYDPDRRLEVPEAPFDPTAI